MIFLSKILSRYVGNRKGAMNVQMALISGSLVLLTGASVEAGYAYWQYNNVQHAARMGVRIATVSDPVAKELNSMTGLGNETYSGDPMPDYTITCDGKNKSCSSGQMDITALKRLVYGQNLDDTCAPAARHVRGMCDLQRRIGLEQIEITYQNSGYGRAGSPADVVPLITLNIKDMYFNFVFLDIFTGKSLVKMPSIQASAISEDMRSQSDV